MRLGNLPLARDAQQREKHDHRAAACCKPEGACHAVAVPNEAGAEEGGGPEPGLKSPHQLDVNFMWIVSTYRYDGRGSQAGADGAVGGHKPGINQ